MGAATLLGWLTFASSLVREIRATLEVKRQNKELTPEEEAALDAHDAEEMNQPWWKKSDAP